MEFRGRIYKLFPIQSGKSAKGTDWQKLDFIFEYFENPTDRWSDKVLLFIMGERITEADLHENDEVVIGFGHSVREWQGKYFNDVRVYKLEKVAKAQATAKPMPTENEAATVPVGNSTQPQQGNLFGEAAPQAPQSTQGAQVAQHTTSANANAQTGEKDDDLPF